MSRKKRYTNQYDERIGNDVFSALLTEWQKREKGQGIYAGISMPQEKIPTQFESELAHALFLFYTALTQRGTSNERAIEALVFVQENRPELLDPCYVSGMSKSKLYKAFRWIESKGVRFGGYKAERLAGHWLVNSQELKDSYNGDPRRIFQDTESFSQVFKRIVRPRGQTSFQGIGIKIFALYAYYLHERGLIAYFPSALTAEIHIMRILWATGIIKRTDWAKKHVPTKNHPAQLAGKRAVNIYFDFQIDIALWSEKFMQKQGFSHLEMIPAIWLLGRNFCSRSFQNKAKQRGASYVESRQLRRNPALWPKNYKDPCGACPINQYCKWAIPSYPYWEWGLLVRLGPRVPYPKGVK